MAINVKSLKTVDVKCTQCNGTCFDTDQAKRQANAHAMFGDQPIPNACVDSEIDGCKCPYPQP